MSDATHSHTPETVEVSGHHRTPGEERKVYLAVAATQLVGTVLTVLARYWQLDSVALTIAFALFLPVICASLVACYLMHMLERKAVYMCMVLTIPFFVGMIALPLWADGNRPQGSKHSTHYVP
ncbi:MAG TPA: hypothetical protein VMB21_15885 [Candidatus Limnocylindria bacterium]|jgi:caa(3)-type oxidase subunit IV|nr:hypothetical protein [Candidatus Limnocylindria bacterium]